MIGYVALGSNLGDRRGYLRQGLLRMERRGVVPLALSSIWETEPVDCPDPFWFLNMVARVETGLGPHQVLDVLLSVEREVGRVRTEPNGSRVLDLDLLFEEPHRTEVDTDLVSPGRKLEADRLAV